MDTQAKALIQEMLKALKMQLKVVDSAIEKCLECARGWSGNDCDARRRVT